VPSTEPEGGWGPETAQRLRLSGVQPHVSTA